RALEVVVRAVEGRDVRIAVEAHRARVAGIEPVAEASGVRPAAGPAHTELAVEVVQISRGRTAERGPPLELAHAPLRVVGEDAGARRPRLRDRHFAAGAVHIPVRLPEAARAHRGRVGETDGLHVSNRVMDAGDPGRRDAAPVPARVEHVEGEVRYGIELEQHEIAGRVAGPEGGSRLVVGRGAGSM